MFNPTPTTYVPTRSGMTLQDFIAASATKFELINGERRPKLVSAALHNETLKQLHHRLQSWAEAGHYGKVFSEAVFVLPDILDANWITGSRIPDLMFIASLSTLTLQSIPLTELPDMVVEIVSPEDKATELDEKIDLYLADGVSLVWIVYPERHKVMVYTPDADHPQILRVEDSLEGGELLPGFRLSLSDLFA